MTHVKRNARTSAFAKPCLTFIASAGVSFSLALALSPLVPIDEALAAEQDTQLAAAVIPETSFEAGEADLTGDDSLSNVVSESSETAYTVTTIGLTSSDALQQALQAFTDQESSAGLSAAESPYHKLLAYDPALIAEIGNQNESGHSICCPSYACAYADAVIDGTVHDHSYYTCSSCSWTDWGGGASSYRCVGEDQDVLREAYDQISAGKPTVVHVSWSGGEHWITLIGYQDVTDPDNLSLENFTALDPVDGSQVNAASRFALYGDGCQHISERA